MSEPLIETRGLKRHFHDGQRRLKVLDGIDLTISRGEIVAIIGQSGSGKSTLLGLLGCLDRPTQGELYYHGPKGALRLDKAPQHELNRLRRDRMGFVFQFHHLLPELRAWENVAMPGRIARRPEAELRRRARDLLDQVGLSERRDHIPGKLSGGEQQRVALARALMNEPDLILADEPTGNLDPRIGAQVIDLLWRTVREGDRSMAIVTHELSIARRADRVLLLEGGRLTERPDEENDDSPPPVKA